MRRASRFKSHMQRSLLCGVAATVAALAVFTGGASAWGPAPPGKNLVLLSCTGIGDVTVSVPPGGNNNGVGQIVGAKGHGILVASTVTLTDVTTSTVLNSQSKAIGGGNAHSNQATTTCSGVLSSLQTSTGSATPAAVHGFESSGRGPRMPLQGRAHAAHGGAAPVR